MNSLQIEKILQRDPFVSRYFLGCFPANKIPNKPLDLKLYPFCAVVNTDIAGMPGSHWVAIYSPNPSSIEYFDSFALPANIYIQSYLNKFENIVKSKKILQSIKSTICGRYVIYFLSKRCKNEGFHAIEKHLTCCKSHPNNIVNSFMSRRFNSEYEFI